MAGLIVKLQSQHERILELMDQMNELGCRSLASKKLLASAKQFLLEHLHQEDTELYPILRHASTQDQTISETLLIYAMDRFRRFSLLDRTHRKHQRFSLTSLVTSSRKILFQLTMAQ